MTAKCDSHKEWLNFINKEWLCAVNIDSINLFIDIFAKNMTNAVNKDFIEKCKQGDTDALGELYKVYSSRMIKVIRRYVADSHSVQDILHDGFIVIITHLSQLRSDDQLESWMASIMKNLSIQYLKSVDRFANLDDCEDFEDDQYVEEFISVGELEAIINKLPDGYRTVFRLSVIQNKTHKEIGILLGVAPHSSSSQLYHAKKLLRKLILERRITLIAVCLLLVLPIMFYLIGKSNGGYRKSVVVAENDSIDGFKPDEVIYNNSVVSADTMMAVYVKSENRGVKELKSGVAVVEQPIVMTDSLTQGQLEKYVENILDESNRNNSDSVFDSYITQINLGFTQRANRSWSVGVAYSMSDISNGHSQNSFIQGDPGIGWDETDVDEEIKYDNPISIGLSFSKRLSRCVTLETGFNCVYRHANRSFTSRNLLTEQDIKQYFIGIPLKLNLDVVKYNRITFYLTIGGSVEIPVGHSVANHNLLPNKPNKFVFPGYGSENQYSIYGGLGLQYDVTPSIGLYIEPSIKHYVTPDDSKTFRWNGQSPNITLPIGFRILW